MKVEVCREELNIISPKIEKQKKRNKKMPKDMEEELWKTDD